MDCHLKAGPLGTDWLTAHGMQATASSLASWAQLPSTPALSRQPPAADLTPCLPLCNLHSLLSRMTSTSPSASRCVVAPPCLPHHACSRLATPPCLPPQDFQFFNIKRLTEIYEKDNAYEVHKHALAQREQAARQQGASDETIQAEVRRCWLCRCAMPRPSRTLVPFRLQYLCAACFTVLTALPQPAPHGPACPALYGVAWP